MFPLLNLEAVPGGFMPISEALVLRPAGLALEVPGRLSFCYTNEEAGEVADEGTLQIFRYDTTLAEWQPMPGEWLDTFNNRLAVPIQQLGIYGFAAQQPPPPPPAAPVPAQSRLGLLAMSIGLLLLGYFIITLRQRNRPGPTAPS